MKVYVVTKGYYSDYHIITATTDEALAKKIAKRFSENITDPYDAAQVEVFENAEIKLLPYWEIDFYPNGEEKRVVCIKPGSWDNGDVIVRLDGSCRVTLYAPDVKAAIKIAAEKRAMELAQSNGL